MERASSAGRRIVARTAFAALVCTMALTSCSSGGARDRNQRETAIYLAVLRAALPPPSTTGSLPLVFVSPLAEDRPVGLEVQAALIEKLAAEARIKFVDEEREAIDGDATGRPVLEGGTLIAVGKVPPTGNDFELPVERYRAAADGSALRFHVREGDGAWTAEQIDERPVQLPVKG